MTPDKIHVAIIRYNLADDYNRHTGAAMASVMENCSVPIVFHILHEEKAFSIERERERERENIMYYRELVGKYSCEVEFHNVVLPEWINEENIPSLKKYGTPTGFYRLYMADLLPETVQRVISIGSDIIVHTDLANLYKLDLENNSIAGVHDQAIEMIAKTDTNYSAYCDSVQMPLNTYVNADMLIFNLDKIRSEKSLPNKGIEYLKKHPNTPFLEQDIFNQIFKSDILQLDPQYNLFAGKGSEWIEQILAEQKCNKLEYILHWPGEMKPWNYVGSKYEMMYWYYLSKTPWANSADKFNELIAGKIVTPDEILKYPDEYICRKNLKNKIITLWNLTIPLYIRILRRYWKMIIG